MNNDETYTPCTKCGRPLSYCKGQCCGKPKGCQCQEYGPKVCGAIRPGEPKCPYQAVIPSLTVESVSNLKDLADCFVHVSDINTTFYIDDKHRIMTTWAGLVSVEDYDFEANPLNLRGQIAYDSKNNTAAIYDKQGANYIFQISDIDNNYMLLENKPQINGVTLEGNKTSADLGILEVDEVALVFDTVADMKQATNLTNGSYARTLGFHAINDGGGALYKITNTGTANEMDVIAVGSLFANLMYGNQINVKQLGAYGDNTIDDSAVFTRGAALSVSAALPLYIPKDVYKLTSQINLKSLVIRCDGTLNNDQPLILGALSNGSTNTDVEIFRCDDVTVEGAKNSYFNILHCGDLILAADGSDSAISSIAYCKFDGIDVGSITLTGANSGWINENAFNIKRCMGNLTITGDGSYPHNNNHFNNICIEGDTKVITIDYGHTNYITYRGENSPTVTLGSDPIKCFGNVIQREYASAPIGLMSLVNWNKTRTLNFDTNAYLPTMKCHRLQELNLSNAKKINGQIWINSDGVIYPGWQTEFLSEKLEADYPFIIYLKSDGNAHRMRFTCYDAEDNKIPGNVYMPGINYDSTSKDYHSTISAGTIVLTFNPSAEVKKVELKVTGGNATFTKMTLDMYIPFMNTQTFINTVIMDRKMLPNIPSTYTANNPTWAVGDIIYNSSPTAGGTAAWICTTAGTGSASVWKAISIAS